MTKYVWQIASTQSSVQFKTSFLRIGMVAGRFTRFGGIILSADGFDMPEIKVEIEAASIETHNRKLNKALRSDTFLDAEHYPLIVFDSVNRCTPSGGSTKELAGILTVKGKASPVILAVGLKRVTQGRRHSTAEFSLSAHLSLCALGLVYQEEYSDDIQLESIIRLERNS
jgi:polyisoprenoid-binding protein YceI